VLYLVYIRITRPHRLLSIENKTLSVQGFALQKIFHVNIHDLSLRAHRLSLK
jgi:hypothetical protein